VVPAGFLSVTDCSASSPQFLGRAVEGFSRADEARFGEGAGPGLAIVEVIAGRHGGSAHATNRGGGRADVWLSLPKASGRPRSSSFHNRLLFS